MADVAVSERGDVGAGEAVRSCENERGGGEKGAKAVLAAGELMPTGMLDGELAPFERALGEAGVTPTAGPANEAVDELRETDTAQMHSSISRVRYITRSRARRIVSLCTSSAVGGRAPLAGAAAAVPSAG
jgi:hypothetical protein